MKSKRERRRKSVSEEAQEDRDSGARVPRNGRSHCHVAEAICTNLEGADVARPTDVQKRRAGVNKKVYHRMNRPGLPNSPPFSPAESAAVGPRLEARRKAPNCQQRQRARQEPGISQLGDESEGF